MPVKLHRNTPLNSTLFRCEPLICNLNKIYRLEFQARNSGLEMGSQFKRVTLQLSKIYIGWTISAVFRKTLDIDLKISCISVTRLRQKFPFQIYRDTTEVTS